MSRGEWQPVSRPHPCPRCGKPDWCSTSADGAVLCRRVDDGTGKAGTDANGAPFWIYGGKRAYTLPEWEPAQTEVRADAATLHAVYSALLGLLTLSEEHRANLDRRGLSTEEINRRGYRTLPARGRHRLARALLERFPHPTLAGVPGYAIREQSGRQWPTIGGPAGMLIPVRDPDGRTVALKVRTDGEDGFRYLYVSSGRHGGAGSGAPVHVPLGSTGAGVVRLTEGELKADVATALSGIHTVAIPGVSVWTPAIPALRSLGAERVLLSFDADARRNVAVARALLLTYEALVREGFAVELELWDEAHGKGIDDLLARGLRPEVVTGAAARTAVVGIMSEARHSAEEGGGTPLPLTMAEARERVEHLLKGGRPGADALFHPRTLQAMALLRRYEPVAWGAWRMRLKDAKVALRDLDRVIPKGVRLAEEDRARYGAAEGRSHAEADPAAPAGGGGQAGRRPQIVVNERFMREISADTIAALEARNGTEPFLFRRGSALVRVLPSASPTVENINQAALRGIVDRAADFVRVTENEEHGDQVHPARPPDDVLADILTLPDLPFPALAGVRTVPTLRAPGVILSRSGYDAESGLLLELGRLEEMPPRMPVGAARRLLLDELLIDFPLVGDAARAHVIALLLEPFVRPMIAGATPLYLIDAPTRGTGKGLLTDVVSLISLGEPAAVMALTRNEEETEKRITALLVSAAPMIVLDNVTRLSSTTLAAALTARDWRGRILGASRMVVVPNDATWVATGNNVELSDEIARRAIPIRLDAGVARPEERASFRHPDLTAWVSEQRIPLINACLSLVQAWLEAGMPHGTRKLGRFEQWAALLGGILDVAEIPGFLTDRERVYETADRETSEWTAVAEAWWEAHGGLAVTAGDIIELLRERHLLMEVWGGRGGLAGLQRLGHALQDRRDRVYGAWTLREAGRDTVKKSAAYRLELRSCKTPETPETPAAPPREELSIARGASESPGVNGISGVYMEPALPAEDEWDALVRSAPPAREVIEL